MTPAMGGTRRVPVPDAIARDYLLLALRLDQHAPGLVDAYFGPADLKAQVDMEPLRAPARLRDDAAALRDRLAHEVGEPDRAGWLAAQLLALETQAGALAGDGLPYLEHVTRCFGWTPVRRPPARFETAAAELEELLPGSGPLAERLAAWDDRFVVPEERVAEVADWLVQVVRRRAEKLFGLPDGEVLRVGLVRDRPWSGYNWYEGGRRSRVELNLDLPIRAADLLHTIAHETYPGHHLENAWKETSLVDGLARLESSVLLINTPQCLIGEGLADLGRRFASPPDEAADQLVELHDRARLPIAADPAASRSAAERQVAMTAARRRLSESRVNAALMRHADGRPHDDVLDYLCRTGRMSRPFAEKRLQFIEHPLWRTYVFVYHEGEALLEAWLDLVPHDEQPARFGRLLREQLTPGLIAAELAAGTPA